MEGRFITCIIAVICAQLQLNLRTAVQRVPEDDTTHYQQPSVFDDLDGRLDSPHRPGLDTLMLGSTATELEHKHSNSAENEIEQEERHYSAAIELTTPAVHTPQGHGKIIAPSIGFGMGKQASSPLHLRRANTSPGSPLHSCVDITVIPNDTPDEARYRSPARNAHLEPSCSGSVAHADALSAKTTRVALQVDSRDILVRTEAPSSSGAVTFSQSKEQKCDTSFVLNDMSEIPSPHDLESPPQGCSPRNIHDSYLRVVV